MKLSKKVALLSLTAAGLIGIVGCKSNAKMPVNFVAVTSSDYNAQVTFGTYDYKFQGKINQGSNKFALVGTATQRHVDGGSNGRMGPGGGPGGNSSGPTFDGFGEEEQQGGQQGGEQPGEQPGQGGEQPGGIPGENPGEQPGENPGQGGGQGGGGGFNPWGGGGQETKTLESISVNTEKTEVFINEVISPFTCLPEGSSGDVNWTSSDEKVATVNTSGSITPVAVGTATITGTGKTDASKTASITITVKEENLRQYDWSVEGSYVYEKGYGYKITFNDENKTVIHTDFDRTEGRHEFYYNVKIGETSSVIKFQAKDPTFKDSLAKDYKKWDERDSTYVFYAKATGNNNSVATAYMYLHGSDHSVVLNTPSGSERSLSFGMTWEEKGEGANKEIIVHDGDKAYTADVSVNQEHPGYRINYSGNTYYCSLNPDVKWKKLAASDFEGLNTHEFVGSYTTEGPDGGTKEVNLNLAEDGKAKLYVGSSAPTCVGTWAKDAANKLTITLDDKVGEFQPDGDGKYSVSIKITVSSFFGSSTLTVALNQVK